MIIPGGKRYYVNRLVKKMEILLRFWMVDGDKEGMLQYFMEQVPNVRFLMLGALKNLMAKGDDAEFRQAAKEIPEYIKSKL